MIRPYRPSDAAEVMELLAGAFADDPGWTYVFPERTADALRFVLPRLFHLRLAAGGETWVAEHHGRIAGVACTNVGGQHFGVVDYLRQGLMIMPFRFGLPAVRRMLAADAETQTLLRHTAPQVEHTYASQLAVHADFRGTGVGGALVAGWHERAAGRPVALMTSNARNVPWYENRGFRVVAQDGICRSFTAWSLVSR